MHVAQATRHHIQAVLDEFVGVARVPALNDMSELTLIHEVEEYKDTIGPLIDLLGFDDIWTIYTG